MVFIPTYLYIKQHTITGKLYFGKTKVKMSESAIGKIISSDTKIKMSQSHIGNLKSPETILKMVKNKTGTVCAKNLITGEIYVVTKEEFSSNSNLVGTCKGKPKSPETKEKMRLAYLKRISINQSL